MMSAGRICVLIVVGVGVSLKKNTGDLVHECHGVVWFLLEDASKMAGNVLQGLIVCQKKIGHEKDPKISRSSILEAKKSSCFRNQQPKTKWFG